MSFQRNVKVTLNNIDTFFSVMSSNTQYYTHNTSFELFSIM